MGRPLDGLNELDDLVEYHPLCWHLFHYYSRAIPYGKGCVYTTILRLLWKDGRFCNSGEPFWVALA